ncbi:MAG: 16S rRNA (cytidine(1402)-2'-O)-methyltransferase [Clostridia bacterium]|nr:16S rRNA (cytidine(1402)-2'-O)-methyltransferase [Clostridia bacterium]
MSGKLYVVGTPIGNLSDFSPRAVETLSKVDFIAAEDTRVTVKLLNHFGISKPMLAYYEHNKMSRGGDVIARLLAGQDCALVSDAGMPAISDPGEDLVRMCYENGIPVESVPGPSALITALAISGMKSGRFCFEGFLSVNKPSRRAHLAEVSREPRTMIFYEAPHKLPATLRDMLEAFGNRNIALVRELTKLHEEVIHTTLLEAAEMYNDENKPRGEFVIIVDGYTPDENEEAFTLEQAVELARSYMAEGQSASSAAKQASADTGHKKGDIYKILCK